MSDKSLDALILSNTALVESVKQVVKASEQTNDSVKDLTESVNELIVDRAVRVEHDVAQAAVNEKINNFIDHNNGNLLRLARWYSLQDKIQVPIIAAFVFGILALLGFDWKK